MSSWTAWATAHPLSIPPSTTLSPAHSRCLARPLDTPPWQTCSSASLLAQPFGSSEFPWGGQHRLHLCHGSGLGSCARKGVFLATWSPWHHPLVPDTLGLHRDPGNSLLAQHGCLGGIKSLLPGTDRGPPGCRDRPMAPCPHLQGLSWTVRLSIQHPAGGSFLEVVCSSRLYTSVILNFKECAHIPFMIRNRHQVKDFISLSSWPCD